MPDFDVNEGYTDPGADRAGQSADNNSAESDGLVHPGEELLLEEWLASMYGPIPALECVPDPAANEPRPMPERTPVVVRVREGAAGHLRDLGARPKRRVRIELIARRRMHARRACPFGRRARVLGRPLSTCRQLPSKCHGQRPSPQESC
jgi:hypothetical protein